MGMPRTLHYWWHRVFRTGDSTYRITAGLASGVAASFNPLIGTHVIQAFFLAWLLRASWIAAFLGTAIINPTTIFFAFWLSYKTGVWALGLFGMEEFAMLPQTMSWAAIKSEPMRLALPMIVGGYMCGAMAWPLTYAVFYFPVRTARRLYDRRRGVIVRQRLESKP